jgi:hypothetical protein
MLLWLLACTTPPDRPDDTGGPEFCNDTGAQAGTIDPWCSCLDPAVEVGTGTKEFEVLGDELEMVFGAQGGWHLTAAARVENTRNVVFLNTSVTHVDSGIEVTGGDQYYVQLVDDEQCVGTFPNLTLVLFPELTELGDYAVHTMSCTEARIDICATDTAGRTACSSRTVFVHPDPDNVESGLTTACP